MGVVSFFILPSFGLEIKQGARFLTASIFGTGDNPAELLERAREHEINILIVPGHDKESYNTEFRGSKEERLNNELGWNLFRYFRNDPVFNTSIVRDRDGNYAQWFIKYIDENRKAIEVFRNNARSHASQFRTEVLFTRPENAIYHNPASDKTSLYLYAINKIANERRVDIVLHIHFNDYPRRQKWLAGDYNGFAIYIPEEQLPNAEVSRAVADALKKRLIFVSPPSNLPKESAIVPTQQLIAVGSNGSRVGASLLIEYDYIYEPRLHDPTVRDNLLNEMAYQTYAGIKEFFELDTAMLKQSTLLPHEWSTPLRTGDRGKDVLALQAALAAEGLYPPRGFFKNSCPVSGYYGTCTKAAVSGFQKKYSDKILALLGLSFPTGIAGEATLSFLRSLYGH